MAPNLRGRVSDPSQPLTLGQASRLAGMGRLRFQHLIASRNIPVHYDLEEIEQDLATLRLGRS